MNTQRAAVLVLAAGLLLTVAALLYLPHSPWGAKLIPYGTIGDTIGGIAGPILNFAGLIVLYFSLREQFAANQLQVQELTAQRQEATNEANFNIALHLVDKLIMAANESKETIEAHNRQAFDVLGIDQRPAQRALLNRQFLNTSYLFTYVATAIDQDQFTPNQLKAINGLLLSFYKPYLDFMQQQLHAAGESAAPVEQQIHLLMNGIRFKANEA